MMDRNKLQEKLQYFKLKLYNSKVADQKIKTLTNNDKLIYEDNNGYLYFLSYSNMHTTWKRDGAFAIFFNKNPFTYENIINYLKINHIPIKLVSSKDEIDKATTSLQWKCVKHNETFGRSWNQIKNGAIKCNKCLEVIRKNSPLKPDFTMIENHFNDCGCVLLSTENNYENNQSCLEYVCNKHKDKGIQTTTWQSFQSSISCPYCSQERVFSTTRKTQQQFIQDLIQVHGDDYTVLTKYQSSNTKITLLCNKCNHQFSMKPSHLLQGHGCPTCNMSRGEKRIDIWLQNNNISYASQYAFEDCKGKSRKMPFDFAIFEDKEKTRLKCLIEYQGEQHYKPVRFNGINDDKAKVNLNIVQRNDKIKKDYCVNNDIYLLEIPYWKFNNIEEILNGNIN